MRIIPAKHLWAALAVGFLLRLAFVLLFPGRNPDAHLYEKLARNLLDHGIYGLVLDGELTPLNLRGPGYPAFVAAVYALFGRTVVAVRVVQAFIDTLGCLLVAHLAGRLADPEWRSRVAIYALWLAIVCPFFIQFTAVAITEVLAITLTAAALLAFSSGFWLVGGLVTGVCTLIRPDTPLLIVAVAVVSIARWRRPDDWPKLIRAGAATALGLALTLLPWMVRNGHSTGSFELFARGLGKGVLPSEYVPNGYYDWTMTWVTREDDMRLAVWPVMVKKRQIQPEALPEGAFGKERERVTELLMRYNADLVMTPDLDREFAEVARALREADPVRTVLLAPLERAMTLWFGQRLPGKRFPALKSALWLLNIVFVALAVAGAWRARRHPELALLLAFVVVRTAAFALLTWPEPRFVVECYPIVLALVAQNSTPTRLRSATATTAETTRNSTSQSV